MNLKINVLYVLMVIIWKMKNVLNVKIIAINAILKMIVFHVEMDIILILVKCIHVIRIVSLMEKAVFV